MSSGTSSEASVYTKSLQVSSSLYTQIASFDNKPYSESVANLPYFINFLSKSFRGYESVKRVNTIKMLRRKRSRFPIKEEMITSFLKRSSSVDDIFWGAGQGK